MTLIEGCIELAPCLPSDWKGFGATIRGKGTIEISASRGRDVSSIVDGKATSVAPIEFPGEGRGRRVDVVLVERQVELRLPDLVVQPSGSGPTASDAAARRLGRIISALRLSLAVRSSVFSPISRLFRMPNLSSTSEGMMKNILLLVHDDDGQEARLQTALDLTLTLQGHLTCIAVTPPVIVAGDLYAGFGERVIIADEHASEARNKTALSLRLAQEAVDVDWIDAYGDIVPSVLRAASLADLIVLNRKLDEYPVPDMRGITSKILMHTRVPVVAVPEGLARFGVNGKAVIAWDGQTSVIATMRACVPLLRLASAVEIFCVRDGPLQAEPEEAAKYLARHGIASHVRVVKHSTGAVARLVAEECENRQADYVLMGAYSHGRLLETFGGTTRRMLTDSAVPIVLGH